MSSERFPLSHRLIHSQEFDAVFKSADIRISKSALLLLAKHNSRGFNRLGIVIAKKHVNRAVDRNRIKRQIRESFRRICTPAEASMDIVVLARPAVNSETRLPQLLEQSFKNMCAGDMDKDRDQLR